MKTLKQISLSWWQKATNLSADRQSFETGYSKAKVWIPIGEFMIPERTLIVAAKDYIFKTTAGRIFRGHIDWAGDVLEFDGFEVGSGGSSYTVNNEEIVEFFKELY